MLCISVGNCTEDSQQPKSESQRLLDRVSELITSLHQVQNARLGSQPPAHLSDVSSPTPEETSLGKFCLLLTHVHVLTHTQPFNGPLSMTTWVGWYQMKRFSPIHTHLDHQTSFINFLHLLRSILSSLFNLRA